jgi:hypothetical protein
VLVVLLAALLQVPQNPSPMSDTTRPHPRVTRYDVAGQRAMLSIGTLYIPPAFDPRGSRLLFVHFHGAPWLLEHHASRSKDALLVTVHLGGGSRIYSDAMQEPGRFLRLVEEAVSRASELTGRRITIRSVRVSAFSAGYGAVRSLLQQPEQYARVDSLFLADSLHAPYSTPAGDARAVDLPVDRESLGLFFRFAGDAVAGRKQMEVTHSEVFPGTYASTTETADALLDHMGLKRRRVLRDGPLGMQQLSDAGRGGFRLRGYAGTSAPDHMDHLYALGEWWR